MTVLPREFSVARSASAGVEEKATHIKDLQLSPDDLSEIVGIDDGDFLKVVANHGDEQLQVYCRVEERDESFSHTLQAGDVGLGLPIREALGVSPKHNDSVIIKRTNFANLSLARKSFNKLLRYRPVTVRTRRSLYPDSGQKIVRINEAVREVLGIEWGDRVVLQSSDARVREIKALPVTSEQQEQIQNREDDPDSRYPVSFNERVLGQKTGTKADIPRAYLSASIRDDLKLAQYGNRGGIYQPIKIHRDTRDLFFRLGDDLTIPFLLGVVGLVIGIDMMLWAKLLILAASLALVVLSVIFQSRRVLLE